LALILDWPRPRPKVYHWWHVPRRCTVLPVHLVPYIVNVAEVLDHCLLARDWGGSQATNYLYLVKLATESRAPTRTAINSRFSLRQLFDPP
jgi:hypothetical protein